MKCPKCKFNNPDGTKFCGGCGAGLQRVCPKCKTLSPPEFKFCGECGHSLDDIREDIDTSENIFEGERKYITVMFTDLCCGYTALSDRLDPEDVKDLMNRIFGAISQVITKYEGFIEKFIGDAVVAFFGLPKAHEDDAVRALRAAKEIHEIVESIGRQMKERIGRTLMMHSGINSGLVVADELNVESRN